jgi:hypothetical protein
MLKFTSTLTACAALLLLGIGMSPLANADPIPPNSTLIDGTSVFDLVAKPPGPPTMPQEFVIGFNPILKPPGPPIMPTLDLTNAGNPLIDNPSTSSGFSIFWGMKPPSPNIPGPVGLPAVQFTLPMDATGGLKPPNPNIDGSYGYDFSATDGTNIFDIFFTITGSAPIDPTSWVLKPPGPPVLPAVQFDFNFLAAGDPTFSFLVYENGQQLSFSPASNVPEPATYTLLLAGLGLIGFMAHRKQNFSTAA